MSLETNLRGFEVEGASELPENVVVLSVVLIADKKHVVKDNNNNGRRCKYSCTYAIELNNHHH